jgi:hypothetical protein
MLVAQVCNPTYSKGKDQEDHSSRPTWANSLRDPILKIPNTKQGWGSDSSVQHLSSKREAMSSNPSNAKKIPQNFIKHKSMRRNYGKM